MLVRQVLVGFQVAFLIGYEDDLLAIGGNMGEPRVACLVECHLRLLAPVCLHAPYLHQPAADRVKPDVLAAGRILRTIVETFGSGEPHFLAALCGDNIDIEVAFTRRAIGELLPIGAPAMQIARGERRDEARGIRPGEGQGIDARLAVLLRPVADGDLPAIGREDMVVVATHGKSRIDFLRLAGLVGREAEEVSAAVIDEPLAVVRPVGGFDEVGKLPDDGPLPAGDIQRFPRHWLLFGRMPGQNQAIRREE